MPIEMTKFKEAQRPLESRILELLSNNNQAYSLWEIMAAMEGYEPDAWAIAAVILAGNRNNNSTDKYKKALEKLLAENKIELAVYQGTHYFGLKQQERLK